ncbi:hypothetical protein MFFDBJGM_02854 [Pectobacterium versatile]|nr:hypothetical protein [Pectobacterium carotovorum subsp. carotovorum]RUR93970.1 hypothetical protein PB16LOC_01207 [Pectobacterium versatile]GBO49837.1 hypothetical protein MFFDBJGM_02854 [Pectobacterium versatile]
MILADCNTISDHIDATPIPVILHVGYALTSLRASLFLVINKYMNLFGCC